jgi:hypothetical protein
MSERPDQSSQASKGATDETREHIERLFRDLLAFVQTKESDAILEKFDQLKALRKEEPIPAGPVLTPLEEKALRFIQRQQAKGRFPTVREVAKAAGRKSSRTGAKILHELRSKGIF